MNYGTKMAIADLIGGVIKLLYEFIKFGVILVFGVFVLRLMGVGI